MKTKKRTPRSAPQGASPERPDAGDDPAPSLVGLTVAEPLPQGFIRHTLESGAGVILQLPVIPPSFEAAKAFFEAGANEYEVQVRVGADGRVEEVTYRVDQHPHSRRSFTPRGAPAWIFGPGATFTVQWDDLAPAAQHLVAPALFGLVGH